ncbi:TonB-dependent receptor [Sphingomonas mesophila]|uniref:TonB-dependent receptor n=1 Tax=Sphingomonas mesophila TaxID=2303576 RepID=UPI0013C35D8F|nr:TonB-dependent receptor [Sphingomonas mesophila]
MLTAAAQVPAPLVVDEEIVITGERVTRSLKQTDGSVEVFDRRRLEREPGADRLDELLDSVPNVLLGNPGQGPSIRGQDTTGPLIDLAAFLGGTRPRTTLNIDGRAASHNELVFGSAPLWDVAQVEVFRSPQSTVEGRNSIAGAIYVRTRSPAFEWEGAARAMSDNRGGRQASAMVGGPLVEDALAFRLAVDGRRARPWSTLADRQRGADPVHDDYGLVRGKLLATPAALAGSRFELTLQHLRSKAPQTVTTLAPFEDRRDPLPIYGIFANRISSATLRGEVPLDASLDLLAIASLGQSRFRRFAPRGRGEALNKVADRSLETRIDWAAGDALRLSGGIHVLSSRLDQEIDLSAIVGLGAFYDRQTALGLFGEVEWKLSPALSATVSLRRQSDRQRREGAIIGALTLPVDYDRRFAFWLPRAALRWDVNDDLRVGAVVQRASNPGGISLNFVTGEPELLDAETLWNVELFGRARLLDGRLTLSANMFRNAHRDAQRAIARTFVGPRANLTWFELYNVARARTEGLEASAEWRPSERLSVRAALGLLRTRISDGGEGVAFDGKSFARAPKRSLTLAADWTPLDRLTLSGRLRHHSGYFSDDLNSAARRIDAGTEADVRAAWSWRSFTLSAYARNLTDAFAVTYLLSPTVAVPNKPREIGIGLETRF